MDYAKVIIADTNIELYEYSTGIQAAQNLTDEMPRFRITGQRRFELRIQVDRDSLVLLEQIRTIDKARLREYIGTLDGETILLL